MVKRFVVFALLTLLCLPATAGVHVAFVEPSSQDIVLVAPASFTVRTEAYAWSDGERITSHRLFRDGVQIATGSLVGETHTAVATISGLGPGSYSFTAAVTSNRSASANAGITVTVNAAPHVQLGAVTGSPYIAPATLGLSANAWDTDGSVAKVEFYANGHLVGTDFSAPYEVSWAGVGAGTHAITARAYDNRGTATSTGPSHVTVTPSRVIGHIEGVSTDADGAAYVHGWACSTGLNQSIEIHTYAGGGWPVGTHIDTRPASQASEPAVAAACQAGGAAYRFTVPLTNAVRDAHGGRAIHIHGISPVGQPNDLIGQSGHFAVPPLVRVGTFVAQTLPTTMLAGQSYHVSVQVRNDGNITWRESDGYRLGSASPHDNLTWGLARVGAIGNVRPGEIANFHFVAKAPSAAGTYSFQWQMVQDGVTWFPPQTPHIPVRVVSGSISASPNPCAFPTGGSTCSSVLSWNSTAADAEVWRTDANNGNAQLVVQGQSGSHVVGHIEASIARFHLKAAGVTMATVDVTGAVNPPPVVQLTSPIAGTTATPPAVFALRATASDADGIASVAFYANGQLLGTDTSAPYEWTWSGVGSGQHSVHAVATDNRGGTASTTPVGVLVNAIPSIQLTAPSAGNNGIAPAAVVLSASAGDADDGVAAVAFYANGALLHTQAAPPYAFTWSNVAAGSHTVHAVVSDTRGATASTPPVSVVVVAPVVNPASSTRYYVYDRHQRLCKLLEPETRATVMAYDLAGNLAWSATGLELHGTGPDACDGDRAAAGASGRAVTREYDSRSRLSHLRFPDGRGDQAWTYTPDGKPARISTFNDGPGQVEVINAYSYNKRGQLVGESVTQPGWYTWGIGYAYNPHGHLQGIRYPSDLYVNYVPNALGQPRHVVSDLGTYASGISYHPNGSIREFSYGNGVVHQMAQNTRQLPSRVTSSGGVLDYAYQYDANGNVSDIHDHALGAVHNRHMGYDGLDRLTAAGSWAFGGDAWHRFTYDRLDNLTSWKLGGVKDLAEYYYEPGTHRLLSIRNSLGSTVTGIGYDAQGNVTNKNGQGYDFDFGNRLRGAVDKEHYRYDGHGRRVLAWSPQTGSILSQYASDGKVLFQEDHRKPGVDAQEHIHLAGSLIATHHRNYATGARHIRYQHTDALGSPVAVTDQAGTVVDRTHYDPYGAAIGKTVAGVGHTGHVMDAQTGLTYMQQRYYDPGIGLFLSVDPVGPSSGGLAHFNRYRYANGNPYRFTDPDGRAACGMDWDCRVADRNNGMGITKFEIAGAKSNPEKFLQRINDRGNSSRNVSGAARYFARAAMPVTIATGREVGADIAQLLSGKFSAVNFILGQGFSDGSGYVNIGGAYYGPGRRVALAHTHPVNSPLSGIQGKYSNGRWSSEFFSTEFSQDVSVATFNRLPLYLATPDGRVVGFDAASMLRDVKADPRGTFYARSYEFESP